MKKSQKVTSRTAESLQGNDSDDAVENPRNRKQLSDSGTRPPVQFEFGPFRHELTIILAASPQGICRHFDCAN